MYIINYKTNYDQCMIGLIKCCNILVEVTPYVDSRLVFHSYNNNCLLDHAGWISFMIDLNDVSRILVFIPVLDILLVFSIEISKLLCNLMTL
jgi:hypothetical protein